MVEKARSLIKKPAVIVGSIVGVIIAALLGYAAYVYAVSPPQIRKPSLEHYHFRMQVLVDGEPENFGAQKYQQDYDKDSCNAELPEQPIHFHDNKDQFVHIHWEGMTAGMVLKYYGWNFIGGPDNILGYKLDDLTDIQKVTIHGDNLPDIPDDAEFFVYTGNQEDYRQRSFDDFVNKDLEEFFGKQSNLPVPTNTDQSLWNRIFPKVYAHAGEDHINEGDVETEEQVLTRINNLIGDVIIFVQPNEPSESEIQARFEALEPLSDSTCGG